MRERRYSDGKGTRKGKNSVVPALEWADGKEGGREGRNKGREEGRKGGRERGRREGKEVEIRMCVPSTHLGMVCARSWQGGQEMQILSEIKTSNKTVTRTELVLNFHLLIYFQRNLLYRCNERVSFSPCLSHCIFLHPWSRDVALWS